MPTNQKYFLAFIIYLIIGTFIVSKFVCPVTYAKDVSVISPAEATKTQIAGITEEQIKENTKMIVEETIQEKEPAIIAVTDVIVDEKDNLEIAVPKQIKTVSTNTSSKNSIVVKSGDCLSKLAAKHYGSGHQYMQIFEANRNLLNSPHLIYPGQVLTLP